jgi:hypothetical protein
MRKSTKSNVAPGKGRALPRPLFAELTCSEGQVEEVLSAGESTEEDRLCPPKPTERKPLPRLVTSSRRFANGDRKT